VGKTKRGKGKKLTALADYSNLPVSVYATSASQHEVTLVGMYWTAGSSPRNPNE
jgi:hypothetical protein